MKKSKYKLQGINKNKEIKTERKKPVPANLMINDKDNIYAVE